MRILRPDWFSERLWKTWSAVVSVERSPDGGEDTPSFRYSLDEDNQPLIAIVEAVAWVKGVDVRELEPLYHVVDVEKLREHLRGPSEFTRSSAGPDRDDPEVTFRYEDCTVTVRPDTITVRRE